LKILPLEKGLVIITSYRSGGNLAGEKKQDNGFPLLFVIPFWREIQNAISNLRLILVTNKRLHKTRIYRFQGKRK
jgi:hypothetical protein